MKNLIIFFISMTLFTMIHANTVPIIFGTSKGRDNGSKGIYATTLDTRSGELANTPALVADVASPGFQVLHPSKLILYSIGSDPETNVPHVYSFSFETDDAPAINLLNQQPTKAGRSAHIDVDPTGRMLVTVQYGEGSVSVFPLNEDGSIVTTSQTIQHDFASKAHENRQEKPHPHNVTFDPSGKYALVPDLGADLVYIYKADFDSRKLILHDKVKTNPAAGPRHMKFSENGKFAYVLNELDQTVDAFTWNSQEGSLTHLANVEGLPDTYRDPDTRNTASEVRIHPNGKFLYTANRGHNSLSVFSIDQQSGIPRLIQVVAAEVDWPRNFALDPSGHWLICAGQFSNDVVVFEVNPNSGKIHYQQGSRKSVPGPICVLPVAQ